MMINKLIASAIVAISVFSFAACNSNKENAQQEIEVQQTDTILSTVSTQANTDTALSTVKEIINQKSEMLQDAANDTKEGVKVVAENAKEKLKQTSSDVMTESKEIVDKTIDKTKQLSDEAQKNFTDTKQKIEDKF